MLSMAIITDPKVAEISLDPIRGRILAALVEPGSATSLAETLGLTRQKVNYHLRALENSGLAGLVEERRKGNMTERIMQASASSYVIAPAVLSSVMPNPDRFPDRMSAQWLIALCSRAVGEVGELIRRSRVAGKSMATFGIDAEIDFASAGARASFAADLSDAIEALVAKYHDASSPNGRTHRLVVGLHPKITRPDPTISSLTNQQQGS